MMYANEASLYSPPAADTTPGIPEHCAGRGGRGESRRRESQVGNGGH
jgi:hypothetical protein